MSVTGDTASNLGNAMDELMRHQPSLRSDATKAIIKVTISTIDNLCKNEHTVKLFLFVGANVCVLSKFN